ncbi:SMI1/KNR4 family protein [Polaribacter batillariae]|uniref:SMI1/KNR4 family protein n=1 Tax=Polaribacter batillariae TaxID=2808900 RepID=A0ABX7T0G3_9FLAO|nr:SMI1/KNR4 family protein [Polaribacter batillariae]QTD39018.1 SMI1/KNR4 family protein [Polaribacter batillariae]
MIQFIAREQLIEQTDIDAFETFIGATLPEAYKQQLLKYNGGEQI